jgi:hypothetical protein
VPVPVNGKIDRIVLSQARAIDAKRLYKKLSELPEVYRGVVSKRFIRTIDKNIPQA